MGIMYLYSMQEGRALRLGSESVMRDALPRIIGGRSAHSGGRPVQPPSVLSTAIEPSIPILGGMD